MNRIGYYMKRYLILTTATDAVTSKLLRELDIYTAEKYCLIQSSLLENYQKQYKGIRFIDINRESFYNMPESILDDIKKIHFDIVYVPVTNVRATNYGHVLEIINKLDYGEIVFYNCKGEKSVIEKKGRLQEKLIKMYINLIGCLYAGR